LQTTPFLLSPQIEDYMAAFHASFKSDKPGTARTEFEYITRQGDISLSKKEELLWWTSKNIPTWASGPKEFFAAADQHERANGAAYRELEINLPKELPLERNIALSEAIAETLLGPRPVVLAIHEKVSEVGAEPHPHLHAMYSDRPDDGIQRTAETHFRRSNAADPTKGGARKLSGGLTPSEVFTQAREDRKLIASKINEALQEHGVAGRVDSRSLKDRGINREPERYLGVKGAKNLTAEERGAIRQRRAAAKKAAGDQS